MSIIDNTSLSHSQIVANLKAYVTNLEEGSQWKDWLASSDSSILMEWIGALGTYNAYQATVNRFESSLQNARLDTSVSEHAFNRGYCTAPTSVLELQYTIISETTVLVSKNELVGYLGDYELYCMTDVFLTENIPNTIDVYVGKLLEYTQSVTGWEAFTTMEITLPCEYCGLQGEELLVDNEVVQLFSELNYLEGEKDKSNLLIRRSTPYCNYIYIGNGVLGWYDEDASEFKYNVLCFNSDINDMVTSSPSGVSGYSLSSAVTKELAVFTLDTEKLRTTAIYFPLDGRITTSPDYRAIIFKYYGSVLYDVYSYNSDPEQEVYLLEKPLYFTAEHLESITRVVDKKRGLGMKVNYHQVDPDDGVVFDAKFKVISGTDYTGMFYDFKEFLDKKLFTFYTEDTTISTAIWAVELTKEFGLLVYPDDTNTQLMETITFLKEINIEVDTVD